MSPSPLFLSGLADGRIAIPDPVFGKNNLPELVPPRTETASTGKQVVCPHALKPLVVGALDTVPVFGEVPMPGH
jgi:hypothetical protein